MPTNLLLAAGAHTSLAETAGASAELLPHELCVSATGLGCRQGNLTCICTTLRLHLFATAQVAACTVATKQATPRFCDINAFHIMITDVQKKLITLTQESPTSALHELQGGMPVLRCKQSIDDVQYAYFQHTPDC